MIKKIMKEFFTKHKSEIMVGVVVFIITTLLTELFRLIISAAPGAGSSVIKLLGNVIYASAAKQSSDSLFRELLMFVYSCGIVFIFVQTTKSLKLSKNTITESLETLSVLEKAKKGELVSIPKKEKKSAEDILHLQLKISKKLKRLSILLLVIALLLFFLLIVSSVIPNILWNQFNRDVTMITPYSDEETIAFLRSDWVRMNERDDYIRIYNTIDLIKANNQLD